VQCSRFLDFRLENCHEGEGVNLATGGAVAAELDDAVEVGSDATVEFAAVLAADVDH